MSRLASQLKSVPPFRWPSLRSQPVPRVYSVLRLHTKTWTSRALAARQYDSFRRRLRSFEISGQEHLPKTAGPVGHIFAANHLSYVDAKFIGFAIWKSSGLVPWYMAKTELFARFRHRLILWTLGGLPFNRLDPFGPTLAPFVSILKAGHALVIFPEGTNPGEIEPGGLTRLRSDVDLTTGLLPQTSRLIPLLCEASGARVIPVGVSGTGRVVPPEVDPGGIWPARAEADGVIKIRFGPPMDVAKATPSIDSKNFTAQRLMPAISSLVDFSLHEIPHSLPLSETDIAKITKREREIADEYERQGKSRHAQIIRGIHAGANAR